MLVAIGRIINTDSLIGLRIFDTNTKIMKDIKLDNIKQLKIKNINNINKLGTIDNKQEDKPIVVLGYKDNKYVTVDINGNTKILDSLDSYNTVDLLTNVEQYKKYQVKQTLVGEMFKFKINEKEDKVILTEYIPNKEKFRVIEIPSFVTDISIDNTDDFLTGPFSEIKQDLKVIYKGTQIKSMRYIFGRFKGNQLDLSELNTNEVTDMSAMFMKCTELNKLDIKNFNTNKVTDMYNMFDGCFKLTSLDISNFDTSKVINMGSMFECCWKLTKLDLSNFNTINVKSMHRMFSGCFNLVELSIEKFNTNNVTNMCGMFNSCHRVVKLNLKGFNTHKVKDMSKMFEGCYELKILDLSNFDTSKVENMSEMFKECAKLTELDLSNFDTSKVKDIKHMFDLSSNLTVESTNLKVKE